MKKSIPWYLDVEAMIVALIIAFLLSSDVFASFTVPQQWFNPNASPTVYFSTPGAACSAIASGSGLNYTRYIDLSGGSKGCVGINPPYDYETQFAMVSPSSEGCPTNSTESGGECTCNSGYTQFGSTCLPTADPCPSDITVPGSTGYYNYGTTPPTVTRSPPSTIPKLACTGSKRMTFIGPTDGTPASTYQRALINGVANYFVLAYYEYLCTDGLHDNCVSGDTDPTAAATSVPADTCPGGHVLGQINGKTVCYSSTGTPINPNTGTSADSTTNTTTHSDGTTTKVTTNADGSVTTNVYGANGELLSSTTTPPINPTPESEYCKSKPQDPLCRTTFTGDCTAEFQCSGDAIQCAQAREAANLRCEMTKRNSLTTLGELLSDGNDPAQSLLPTPSDPTVVNVSGSLVTTGFLGAAGCPPDQSFSIAGNSFVIPWSKLCGIFQTLGYVLMVIAAIASARIVLGSKS